MRTGERDLLRAKFREYRKTRDRRLRNELIEAHQSLATHLARRFVHRGEPFDDLLQVAQLGMLKAVERFDPNREIEFSTFATATIEGELKRHFRDRTWSVRVPRRSQELHLRMATAVGELSQRLQRTPRVDELAEDLGLSEDAVLEAIDAGAAYRSSSLEARPSDPHEAQGLDRRLGRHDEGFDLAEHRVVIEKAMADLPPREQTIIRLRFFEELTQTEIAQQVGISQMHVSRLLARTLSHLRARVEAFDSDA